MLRAKAAPEPPADASEDEVAKWFEENDLSDIEVEDVTDAGTYPTPPELRGLRTVSLRLPASEIEELRKRAERLGIGYTTYIRLLVNRHVLDEPPIR